MGLGTIILLVVIVLLILGIGFSAFWDALVRGFNIVRDRAEEFVDEQQSNRETPLATTTTNSSKND
jgi:hypothetical protein